MLKDKDTVITQRERLQIEQLFHLCRQLLQLVVIQHQGGDTGEVAHLRGQGTELVPTEVNNREENHVLCEVEL